MAKLYHKISVFTFKKILKKNFSFPYSTNIRQQWCLFCMAQYYPREVTSLWGYDGPLAQLYPGTGQTLPQTMG